MISSKPMPAFSSSKLALSSKDRTGLRECMYGVHGTVKIVEGKKGITTVAGQPESQLSNLSSRCYFKWGCESLRLSTVISDQNYAEGRTVCKIIHRKHYMCASSKHKYGPEPKSHHSSHSKELLTSLLKTLDAFHRFSRPHTIMGTVVGITSVSLLPVESMADLSPVFFIGLFKAILGAIFMNIYIVGLNQLFDVEIDKINKPTLPLASGEFSREMGIVIVAAFCMMSFFMGIKSQSPPLLSALLVSYFLGTAYSIDLPLLRWKQHAFLAATCILCVRAILVQLAFFVHMQRYVLGRSVALTKPVIFATIFMCFFSAVIALFKDIPDVDGDRNFGIRSFSVRLGKERVFWLCIKLLLAAYGIAMIVGVSSANIHHRFMTVLGHAFLAYVLWFHAQSIDIQNKESITSFYMFIWKLFYAEYLLIPFVR